MGRELYSKTKLASELGVDRRTLDARLDGLPHAQDGARNAKLYHLRPVFEAFLAHAAQEARNHRRSLIPAGDAGADAPDLDAKAHAIELASAKLRREQADAELAEIKVAKERGVLVEAERVEGLWAGLVVAMRAKLLSLPGRAATQSAGMSIPEVEALLESMVREALDELARADDGGEEDETEEVDDDAA